MSNNRFPIVFGALLISAAALAGPAKAQSVEDKLQVCTSCHGQAGVPIDPKTIPIIWGQTEAFLTKQLHDYRAGDRDNAIMKAMAQTLSQAELRPAAKYFAGKPWPAGHAPAAAATPPAGIAQCQACHQPKFEGGMPAPRLAGQSYEFLIKQMNSFADGTRTNSQDMVQIMTALSPADREAMARYIAGL
jgi:cytochrome c553